MKTVLIAGCGYVGSALARRLLAAGYRVLGLKRRPAGLPEGVIPVCCDLADREALRAVLPPAVDSVVLSLAASSSGEEAYEAAYDVALGNLVDALGARSEPPARILFTSSTSVHAQSSGEWVDESSPAEPTHYTGAIMRRAEARVLAAAGPSREAIVLRLGGIYGPGRTRLVEMVRRGEATLTAAPLYTNRIHRDDCAGAIHHLLELERPASLYLGTDAEPAELNAVIRFLAAAIGGPEPRLGEGSSGLDSRRYRTNKRCSSALLQASGYRFQFPTFREGYTALLRTEE